LQSTCFACTCRFATRDEETAAIAQFLESRGATKCPSAYAAPTSTNFSAAEDARRLSSVAVAQKSTHSQIAARMQ